MTILKMRKAEFNLARPRVAYFDLGWLKLCRLVSKIVENSKGALKELEAEGIQRTLLNDMLFGIPGKIGHIFQEPIDLEKEIDAIQSREDFLRDFASNARPKARKRRRKAITPHALILEFNQSEFAAGPTSISPDSHPSLVAVLAIDILDRWKLQGMRSEQSDMLNWAFCLLGWSDLAWKSTTRCKFCPRLSLTGRQYCKLHAQGSPSDNDRFRAEQFDSYRSGMRAAACLENIRLSVDLSKELNLPLINILQLPYLDEAFELPDLMQSLDLPGMDDSLESDWIQLRLQVSLSKLGVQIGHLVNFKRHRSNLKNEIVNSRLLQALGGHKTLETFKNYHALAAYVLEKQSPWRMHHTSYANCIKSIHLWEYLEGTGRVGDEIRKYPRGRNTSALSRLATAFREASHFPP